MRIMILKREAEVTDVKIYCHER